MNHRVRRRPYVFAALALTFLFTTQSHAFKQGIHETVTEQELAGMGFDEDSSDEAGDSSYWVDAFEFWNDAAHVDNNMLDAGSARLVNKKKAVIDSLKSCERRDALDALGEGLHTVQDIYAHSNAVDNVIPIADMFAMSRGTASCNSAAGFAPGGLVSGYFSLGGFMTGDQCDGLPSGWCCHYDLNKDDASVPNGARFPMAEAAARSATRQFVQATIDDLYAEVSGDQATQLEKMLKQRQRTLSFVIDDTGSMYDDIAGVRSAALGVLDGVVSGGEAPTLGLVTFKDYAQDRGEFCDIEAFRSAINGLYASGGGDCPEASNSALLTALGQFPLISTDMQMRGGRILLATDASAGDAALGPLVAAQAAVRGVGIDAILTGDCYAEESAVAASSSGFVPSENEPGATTGRPAVRSMAGDPLTSYSARTQLKALTAQTGGVLFNVARVEVDDVVPTLLELGAPDNAVIRSWRVRSDMGAIGDVEIPVDDTLAGQVSFMVTASKAAALPAFTILDPSGNVVDSVTPGVTRLLLSSVDKYTVSEPAVGVWRLRFGAAGDFVVRAFGRSSLLTEDLRFLDPSVPLVYPDLEMMPLEGQPTVGKELVVDLAMTDAAAGIDSLVLRRDDGTQLAAFTPELVRAEHYRVSFVPPAEPFLIEVGGHSVGGNRYLRQTAVPVQPQSVSMRVMPKMARASVGTAAEIEVTVVNASAGDAEYALSATSDTAWALELPSTVPVPAGGSTAVTLRVWVPDTALEGGVSNIILLVQDRANATVRNSGSATVEAVVNQPPVCTAAQASKPVLWPPKHHGHLAQESDHHRHGRDNMVEESILGVSDPDGDAVGITITGITQDEPVKSRHDRTAPDGRGVGTATASVRNERDERRDGRVYAIHFEANDGQGGSCSGQVNVGVPHDRRHPAVDSGQRYDSTTP